LAALHKIMPRISNAAKRLEHLKEQQRLDNQEIPLSERLAALRVDHKLQKIAALSLTTVTNTWRFALQMDKMTRGVVGSIFRQT
jgi:hypothetical protein